jgi:hypothetical protein
VCQKDWFSSVMRSRFLKYPIIKESCFPKLAWWVNTPAVAAPGIASDVVAGDIALLGLSVHGRLFASRSKIVE